MLEFIFTLYFGNILLGIIAFFITSYLLNKYLKINVFSILKEGFINIRNIFIYFKNNLK